MKKIFISMGIGVAAGIIDIIPMIIQQLNIYACLSAFAQWIILGIIINYTDFGIRAWLKGFIVAELCSVPIIIIVIEKEPVSAIPIFVLSAVLGSLVGFFGKKYAG
jgi:hypothetical protein